MNSGKKKLMKAIKHVATLGLVAQAGGCVFIGLTAAAVKLIF
jgi:hypothetical protein